MRYFSGSTKGVNAYGLNLLSVHLQNIFFAKTMDNFIWTIVQLRYMHLPIYLLEYITI